MQPPPNNRHEMGGDPKTIISIYWVSATAEKRKHLLCQNHPQNQSY